MVSSEIMVTGIGESGGLLFSEYALEIIMFLGVA